MGRKLDQTLAVLNGLVGDHLARTGNALATQMAFYRDGAPLTLEREQLARALPEPSACVVVLVHGVMSTEAIWQYPAAPEQDYGQLLSRDLGMTPLYVRYNSGASILDNGARLADLLNTLYAAYPRPIEELVLIGYSMGGLLARRACRVAELSHHAWLPRVRRAFYVGTPHLGAPAERVGRVVAKVLRRIPDPYTRLIGEISDLRSRGIRDLGDADLHDAALASTSPAVADLAGRGDRAARPPLQTTQHPLPLLPSIEHHLIAGSLAQQALLQELFGDAIVPLSSATFSPSTRAPVNPSASPLPPERICVLPGLDHIALAHHPAVYARILEWLQGGQGVSGAPTNSLREDTT